MSDGWERISALIFEGFEDVRDWMQERGTGADVHRVEDMIRLPPQLGEGMNVKTFADVLDLVVTGCAVRRRIDKTGEQPPTDKEELQRWVADFAKRDVAVSIWLHNMRGMVAHLQKKSAGQKLSIPLLPECGVYCPRRTWDVIMMERTPGADLESQATAEIIGFLRLLGTLPMGEAHYVKTFLHQRLSAAYTSTSISPELTKRAAAAIHKMEEAATLEERALLFSRPFLPQR